MRLSREPVVWRVAILAAAGAAVQVGLLSQDQVAAVDGWTEAALPLATLLLPTIGALWARRRTVPTTTERTAPQELVRGTDGVYRTRPEDEAFQLAERADFRP